MTLTHLHQQLALLDKAVHWLNYSIERCRDISAENVSNEDYEKIEALCSRYGRVVDLLINKIFRTIDQVELLEPGSLIDTVNRAEKRSLITVKQARILKELRNHIVHEYDLNDLALLLDKVLAYSSEVLSCVTATQTYCQNQGLSDL
jgi:hypothetical protein